MSQGLFFDLLYANEHLGNRQYPFLRGNDGDILLIVANFDDKPVSVDVIIPKAAFDLLKIKSGGYLAIDLLSYNYSVNLELHNDSSVHVDIPANRAIALKFKHI